MMPQAADTLERSPTELQRLVRAYLPATWGLVAIGITTSIAEIVQGGFQDKQVIIVDRSPERTRFLYNTLQSVYKEDMQVIRAVVVERSAEHSTGEGTIIGERPGSSTENRNPNEGNPDQAIGDAEDYEDDEAEEEMEDNNPDSDDDGDGEEPSGISLHSQDTHCRGGELEGASTDSSNEEYHPRGTSVRRPISPEYVSFSEEEDEEAGGPQEGQEHCTDFVRRIVEQVFGGEDVEPVISTENTAAPLSQGRTVHMDVDRGPIQEGGAEEQFSAPIATEAAVAPGAEAPTLSMLACTAATMGTDSNSLSFGWAMVDRVYIELADGYYYDPEGVRYHRSGQEGQYSYEQVASVLEGVLDDDQVSSPSADAMVSRALVLATGESPPREPTSPWVRSLWECGTPPDQEVSSEQQTQSSHAAPPAP
jgi:hypothetical protein